MLEREMPYTEFVKWIAYFKQRPLGWREDQRTYMLLSAQGVKASPENIFPTLKLLKANEIESQVPDKALPKGQFLDKLRKAKGGDGSVNLF